MDDDIQGQATSAGSEANALRHGLTAKRFLPGILQPGRLAELKAQFRAEYLPSTVTAEIYVAEAARHAAILELIEAAEPAVMAKAAAAMDGVGAEGLVADDELRLAAAICAEPLEKVARYRRAHERGLQNALDKLSAGRQPVEPPTLASQNPPRFATHDQCAEFLRRRFAAPSWRCPHCRHRGGQLLATREVWECSRCNRHFGIRSGTVMENSKLPLVLWFSAIQLFAAKTSITPAELALAIGIHRQATARHMLRRMQSALPADDVYDRFAGLGSLTSDPVINDQSGRQSTVFTKRTNIYRSDANS